MIFDTHAHYDDKAFDEDREELLASMKENGIGRIVNIGSDIDSTKRSVKLAQDYDFIYAAAGVHPSEVKRMNKESFAWLAEVVNDDVYKKASGGKIVAVGEIGLDYYWDKETEVREEQKKWFEWQMELARAVGLPIVIHSREAAKDTLDMVKSLHGGDIGGVMHCFSYPKEMAREYLNMGFYLGIGGVLTFQNARVLKEVAAYAPLEQIVLETDCPYLAPEPVRGRRNDSRNIAHVAEYIGTIWQMEPQAVLDLTAENARRCFNIV